MRPQADGDNVNLADEVKAEDDTHNLGSSDLKHPDLQDQGEERDTGAQQDSAVDDADEAPANSAESQLEENHVEPAAKRRRRASAFSRWSTVASSKGDSVPSSTRVIDQDFRNVTHQPVPPLMNVFSFFLLVILMQSSHTGSKPKM